MNRLSNAAYALLMASLLVAASGCATVQKTFCPAPSGAKQQAEADDGLDKQACACTPEATAEAEKKDKSARADTPDEPRATATEEVTFGSKGAELSGVVDRPKDIAQPRPAVVVLHAAGPHDRRGVFQGALGLQLPVEVPVYQEIGENLAQNGFVVLRYDKRTCVKGGPPWCDYPREYVEDHREDLASTLIADARAAVGALRERDDVDPNRVFLVGHGQGADIALAMAKDVDAAGLILLAPSPYPLDEVIMHQTDTSLANLKARRKAEGNTTEGTLLQEQIDALTETRRKQKEGFARLRSGELDDPEALGAPAATWTGLFELHDRAMAGLKNSSIPVLALFGDHDLDLPAGSAAAFQKKMGSKKLGRARHSEVLQLPDVTHVMVGLDEDSQETPQVAEDVHQAILHFVDELERAPADQPDS